MSDPMTAATLDALEVHLAEHGRIGGAWQVALLAEVRRLRAMEQRVRELHADAGPSQGYFPGDRDYGERDHCCRTCGTHGEYGVEHPCPTIAALDGGE